MKNSVFVAALLALWAGGVAAQDCVMHITMETTVAKPDGTEVKRASGDVKLYLTKADVDDAHKRGLAVTDTASRVQDKGGAIRVVTNEFTSCDGKAEQATGGFDARGVTVQGWARLSRHATKVATDLIARYERRNKRDPWGN